MSSLPANKPLDEDDHLPVAGSDQRCFRCFSICISELSKPPAPLPHSSPSLPQSYLQICWWVRQLTGCLWGIDGWVSSQDACGALVGGSAHRMPVERQWQPCVHTLGREACRDKTYPLATQLRSFRTQQLLKVFGLIQKMVEIVV